MTGTDRKVKKGMIFRQTGFDKSADWPSEEEKRYVRIEGFCTSEHFGRRAVCTVIYQAQNGSIRRGKKTRLTPSRFLFIWRFIRCTAMSETFAKWDKELTHVPKNLR